jgi:predicted AlkP superfamily phosphohydrolase/phosphomutase
MKDGKRVILLGYDAAILPTVEHFIDDLPNFRRLMKEGSNSEARPSIPAGTPSNWTTVATGAYSSTHGLYGFDDMVGDEPLKEVIQNFNSRRNKAENIWQTAERCGKKAILIHYPTAHPWTVEKSIAVGGSGVSSNEWCMTGPATYSTSDRGTEKIALRPAKGWKVLPASDLPPLEATVPAASDMLIRQTLYGTEAVKEIPGEDDFIGHRRAKPPEIQIDFKKKEMLNYHLLAVASKDNGYDTVLVYKQKADTKPLAELVPGGWSAPLYDEFPTKGGMVEGLFYLKLHELSSDGKNVTIYRTFINRSRTYSHPQSIAEELKAEGIPYLENLEQAIATGLHSFDLSGDVQPLEILLELIELQAKSIADISRHLLNKYPWDIACIQIHCPDSLNHAVGAYFSPMAHKAARAQEIATATEIMRRGYIIMDNMLGRIWAECKKDDDILMVVSDHGGVPSWRYFSLVGLMRKGGFLDFVRRPSGRYAIDREKTKVYPSTGNPGFFINLKGRYPHGIVEPADYDTVRDEFIEYLWSIRDPETNETIFSKVLKREDAKYLGLWGEDVGDVIAFYRPSHYEYPHQKNFFLEEMWKLIDTDELFYTKLGCTHPYHPDEREGIMSTNALFMATGPGIKRGYRKKGSMHLADVAPTMAHCAGMEKPGNADGRVVKEFFD